MKYALYIFLVLTALFAACGSDSQQAPCKDIPAGGCPLAYGVACQDPSCVAVYACNPDGTWTIDHACPSPGALDASTEGSASEASVPFAHDASIDAPPGSNGGPGCPALEQPDCALGDVLACPSGCCNCEDLYVCENGGWNLWGTCDDTTGIHQATK